MEQRRGLAAPTPTSPSPLWHLRSPYCSLFADLKTISFPQYRFLSAPRMPRYFFSAQSVLQDLCSLAVRVTRHAVPPISHLSFRHSAISDLPTTLWLILCRPTHRVLFCPRAFLTTLQAPALLSSPAPSCALRVRRPFSAAVLLLGVFDNMVKQLYIDPPSASRTSTMGFGAKL